MQGIDAAIGDIRVERGRDAGRAARRVVVGAVAAATVGCIAAYALHARLATPVVVKASTEERAAPAAVEDPAALFGAIIVEPEWRPAPPPPTSLASLGPESPASGGASVPKPAPEAPPAALAPPVAAPAATANLPADVLPLPPVRDVPRIDDAFPLPPIRPAELAEPAPVPAAPDRRVAQPGPVSAPADQPGLFQKLLGIVQQPGALLASRPPAAAIAPEPSRPAVAPPPAAASGDGRSGMSGLVRALSAAAYGGRLGYDRQTAIYDISARVVYLPDGTRLEAHSGLGAALDDVRYVGERAVGPTPPHLYELTMRESLFHGVQALRLNPVGEGGLYGRAGLLAHPYMLGPNGDSNGCVSVKDYDAFLRAYQNGQIRKLAVVSRL